jgi:diacylglycerol kinase family enzyme
LRSLVLLNRGGGSLTAPNKVVAEVESALAGAGIAGDMKLVDGSDITKLSRAAAARGDRLLIVGGGDGSISAAAGELAGSGTRPR